MTKKTTPIVTARTVTTFVSRLISFCSGESSSATLWVSSAIVPNAVPMPVAKTTARPVPEATAVPAKTRFGRSVGGQVAALGGLGGARGGDGLAGEGREVHPQLARLDEPRVRADAVPLGEQDHVPGNELLGRDLRLEAVAHDAGRPRQQPAQRRGGALGPELLPEREDGVDDDHAPDRPPELRHPADEGHRPAGPEQQRHQVGEVGEELLPERRAPDRPDRVRPGRGRRLAASAAERPCGELPAAA